MESHPGRALPDEWVSVFRSMRRGPCEERALVLGAMNIECRVSEQPDGCHLLVPGSSHASAHEQLRLYQRENPLSGVKPWPTVPAARGVGAALFLAALVLVSFTAQQRAWLGVDWLGRGELHVARVLHGEWWRIVTALMLHGDAAHAAGNMVFGAFFGYLAGQYLGSGLALLAIAGSAATGNALNVFVQVSGHRSIGASTAVFAALGLVAAVVRGLSRRHALGWARRWSPVVGAVALLAYIGTGDERTDVFAHLAGFLAGAGTGAVLQAFPTGHGRAFQWTCGLLALGIVVLAWSFAI